MLCSKKLPLSAVVFDDEEREMKLYKGQIVYSKSREELAVYRDSILAVEDGVIEGLYAAKEQNGSLPPLPEK